MKPGSTSKMEITAIVVLFILIYLFGKPLFYVITNFFNSSDLKTEGTFINGKKEGLWKTYYLNGQLKSSHWYHHDTLNGPSVTYNKNGGYSLRTKYKMGIAVDSFLMYVDGKLNLAEWRDAHGKTQGIFRVYYIETGSLSQIGRMKNNQLNDTCKSFYQDRRLKDISIYKDNKKQGNWIYFNKDGSIAKTETYKDDSLITTLKH